MTTLPLRARRDGWTPERQTAFVAALTAGGSVAAAAAAVGMSRHSAYRLRRRSPVVAAAWAGSGGPPLAAAELDDIVEDALAQRDAAYVAAGAADRRGPDGWLLGELRAEVRRIKRRAARASRRAGREPPSGVSLGNLPSPGWVSRDATDRGADGRFTAKTTVAASACVTFQPNGGEAAAKTTVAASACVTFRGGAP